MKLAISEYIDAETKDVFSLFSSVGEYGKYLKDVVKIEILNDEGQSVGTSWRETRMMFGKEASEEMEITAVEVPHSMVVEAESHGMHYTSSYSFVPEGHGTRVTLTHEGTPLNIKTKLMSPLMFAFKPSLKKAFKKDILDMKTVLEGK